MYSPHSYFNYVLFNFLFVLEMKMGQLFENMSDGEVSYPKKKNLKRSSFSILGIVVGAKAEHGLMDTEEQTSFSSTFMKHVLIEGFLRKYTLYLKCMKSLRKRFLEDHAM